MTDMNEKIDQFNKQSAELNRDFYRYSVKYIGQPVTRGTLVSWLSWVINGIDVDRVFELTENDEADDFYDPRLNNVPLDMVRIRRDDTARQVQDAAHRITKRWAKMRREAA